MSRKRLIDIIAEEYDRIETPAVWVPLMQPFISACHISSKQASSTAYCDVAGECPAWKYLSLQLNGILRLACNEDDLSYNMDVLLGEDKKESPQSFSSEALRPILIAGEPGVGKTTWLKHFFHQEYVQHTFYHYRFDGLISSDAFETLTHEQFVRRRISEGLFRAMQSASTQHALVTPLSGLPEEEFRKYSEAKCGEVLRETNYCLIKAGTIGWVILDNVDLQPREFQDCAIDYAKQLSYDHFRVIVATRPHTARDLELNDMICVTVPPPSLLALLTQRVKFSVDHRMHKNGLVRMIAKGQAGVHMEWTGDITDKESFEKTYTMIVECLCNLGDLTELLTNIHCHDLHTILRDIRELFLTGSFSKELVLKLSGEHRDERVFVSAYMMGNFHHHRNAPHSGEFITNLFQAPVSRREDRFLLIRILQFVLKISSGNAVSFPELQETLVRFGYDPHAVVKCVRNLVRTRLLVEVHNMANRQGYEPKENDRVELTICGKYYLHRLVQNPRYICAMSHVTYLHSRVVEEELIRKERNVNHTFWNAAWLAEDIRDALHYELDWIKNQGKERDFFDCIERCDGFFVPLVTNCYDRVDSLAKDGLIDETVLNKWIGLRGDADRIQNGKEMVFE